MTDRPLNQTLIPAWRKEIFSSAIPETEEKRIQFEKDGIVAMWPDYDHSVPVWERVFSLGFSASPLWHKAPANLIKNQISLSFFRFCSNCQALKLFCHILYNPPVMEVNGEKKVYPSQMAKTVFFCPRDWVTPTTLSQESRFRRPFRMLS